MYNVWEFEGGSWRVAQQVADHGEARRYQKELRTARGDDKVVTVKDGGAPDDHIRANCTDPRAPWNG